ncbi:hypothetical protein [Bellilinea sp.]|uniref:FHA domain-containing protein n=1 Tax=Bellilinea caldifistulae TaxID=360411 RepID=A0A7C4KZI7_9CHLR
MTQSRNKPSAPHPIGRLFAQTVRLAQHSWQGKTRLQRSGLLLFAAAFLLWLSIPFAELGLSLNPYQPVTDQVRALIASQPDFENRLKRLDDFKASILPPAAVQSAAAILSRHNQENAALTLPTQTSPAPNAEQDSPSQSLIATARAILALQKTLETPSSAQHLAVGFGFLQKDDVLLNLQAIEQIYRQTPALLSQLYEIRRSNLALLRQINALSGEIWISGTAVFSSTPTEDENHPNPLPGEWRELSRTGQSLEIQLANTTYLLNQVLHEIEPVYRQDQVWGFSLWLKAAAWIRRSQSAIFTLSAGLIAAALLLFFWKPLSINLNPRRLASRLTNGARRTAQGETGQLFSAQSNWLVKGLTRRPAAKPLRMSRRGSIQRPRLLIPVSGNSRIEKPLPGDGIVRIGNDPAFPVKIPLSGSEYIELWIRKARKGYYLEIMFSDIPVLLNQQPVLSSRALNDGDSIQIHDTTLLFKER